MKGSAAVSRVKVSAYGHGVSHGGVGMLREVAELTGLSAEVTAVLADTYRGHGSTSRVRCSRIWPRGRRRSGLHRRRRAQRCGDRERVFGAAASSTTIWRLVDAALCPVSGLPRARSGPRGAAGAPLCRSVAAPGCRCHHHYRPSDNKQDAMEILNTTDGWSPAIESRGGIRDGAWVAEATGLRRPVTDVNAARPENPGGNRSGRLDQTDRHSDCLGHPFSLLAVEQRQ